jgi:hypothetical protein
VKNAEEMLRGLDLLGAPGADAKGFDVVFKGTPQSLSVLEAGLTAGSEYWATGAGAVVIATWGTIWWGSQHDGIKAVALGGAFVVTATLSLAVAYLLASDLRGRSGATVATYQARAAVAIASMQACHRRALRPRHQRLSAGSSPSASLARSRTA